MHTLNTITTITTITLTHCTASVNSTQLSQTELNKMKWNKMTAHTHVTQCFNPLLKRTLLKTSVKKRHECGWKTISTLKVLKILIWPDWMVLPCVCSNVYRSQVAQPLVKKFRRYTRISNVCRIHFIPSIYQYPDDCCNFYAPK